MREGGHPLNVRGVICDFLRNSHRVFLFKIVDFPLFSESSFPPNSNSSLLSQHTVLALKF